MINTHDASGIFFLDTDRDVFVIGDKRVALSRIEVHILLKLIEQIDNAVSDQNLVWAAWGVTMDPDAKQNLYVIIHRLRKKIHEPILKRVPHIGYMLTAKDFL